MKEENKTRWRFAPTKREEEQWSRANKSVSGGTVFFLYLGSSSENINICISPSFLCRCFFNLGWDLPI